MLYKKSWELAARSWKIFSKKNIILPTLRLRKLVRLKERRKEAPKERLMWRPREEKGLGEFPGLREAEKCALCVWFMPARGGGSSKK